MKPDQQIKNNGNRFTKPRKMIIEALTTLSKPVTAQEIATYLQKKLFKVDLVSVYRTLHLLSEMGIIHVFEFGEGKMRFELMDKDKHHHYFICDRCSSVKEVLTSDEQQFINEVKKKNTFVIKRHTLEFFGLCQNCQ